MVLEAVRAPWKSITQFLAFNSEGIHLWPLLDREFMAGWSDFFDHSYDFSYNYKYSHRNFNMIERRNISDIVENL